ncbi:MAG: MBL fold metallo-hydrolase, partial [Aquabacterium sp.]
FAQQKATLELIGQLKPRWVIPGHGAPFSGAAVDAALMAAHSRIDWLMEEPRRNSDNALKVLLAFKLLEAQRLTVGELTELVRTSLQGNVAMQAHYPHDPEAMAAFMAEQLVRAGAATREGDTLIATS